jgi:threonine/homoserine/homoserine lactone efflux protein
MRPLFSILALAGGIWLIHMGYERQESLAGRTDNTLSKLGQKIDGDGHLTTHMKYYIAGTVLVIGGTLGLGIVRK